MNRRNKILGLLLLVSAMDVFALTLGRVRGAALVNRPLDLSISAQLAPEEAANSLCVEADVFYADTRQDGSRVRVTAEPGPNQTANIRVLSSVPVDEPMVTVYLKAGCDQKITRRYVLLADVASEPAAPVTAASLPIVAPAAPQVPITSGSVTPTAPIEAAPMPAAPAVTASVMTAAPAAKVVAPAVPRTPKPVAAKAPKLDDGSPAKAAQKSAAAAPIAAKKAPAAPATPKPAPEDKTQLAGATGQSRLKLDPLSTLSDRVATLETVTAAPSADLQKEIQRVQTLEESVKTLVALAAKNEANMLDMRTRLQKAEAERFPMAWLYGLAALVLACLGAIAWLWTRLTRVNARGESRDDWWSGSKGAPLAGASGGSPAAMPSNFGRIQDTGPSAPQNLGRAGPPSGFGSPAAPRPAPAPVRQQKAEDPESQMDVSLVEMSESNFDNLMQSGQAHSGIRKGPLPRQTDAGPTRSQPMEMARSINSDAVFDVRQKADFFVSLGQTDQAVRVLEDQINESGETSPLLYLSLLDILHGLGLRQDYHQFREDFNLLFNSRVPEFAAYGQEGRTLEEYPQVLAHITGLWPTHKAQMVIEASIFKDPSDESAKPFDLAAFRDLLLLHAVAQTNARGGVGSSDLSPLSASTPSRPMPQPVARAAQPVQTVDIPLDSRLDMVPMPKATAAANELDLDLNDLVAPSELPSQPEGETTEFPVIAPPPAGLVDNNFLSFETNQTVQYSLPKPKV